MPSRLHTRARTTLPSPIFFFHIGARATHAISHQCCMRYGLCRVSRHLAIRNSFLFLNERRKEEERGGGGGKEKKERRGKKMKKVGLLAGPTPFWWRERVQPCGPRDPSPPKKSALYINVWVSSCQHRLLNRVMIHAGL